MKLKSLLLPLIALGIGVFFSDKIKPHATGLLSKLGIGGKTENPPV